VSPDKGSDGGGDAIRKGNQSGEGGEVGEGGGECQRQGEGGNFKITQFQGTQESRER